MLIVRPGTQDDWAFIRATAKPTIASALRESAKPLWERIGGHVLDALANHLVFYVVCPEGDPATLLGWIARAPDGTELMSYVSYRFRRNGVAKQLRESAK